MSPVAALTSGLGVRFLLLLRFTAWLAPAALTSSWPSSVVRVRRETAPLTWLGVQSGCSSRRSAAMPEIIGAAIEVPPMRMYCLWTMQVGHSDAKSLPAASGATMWAPGARMSGLANPSWVTPWLDQVGTKSSLVDFVPPSSTAPTVITYGSLAGA